MAKELEQLYECPDVYTRVPRNKNTYELGEIYKREETKSQESLLSTPVLTPNVAMAPKKRQSSWSKPLLLITVLLCLILIFLITILGILVYDKYTNGNSVECTNTATGANSSSYTNEWADRIAQSINQKIPNFNKWANGVVSQVNSNVTGSLPDFNEWAEGVVSKVNSNVTGSLHNFNEWANNASQKSFQLFQNNTNFTELDKKILQTTKDSAEKLINIVNTLSNLQDTSTSTAGVVNDILLIAQELLVLHNESTALPTSCKEIKERQPLSPSGLYLLADVNNATYAAYCNMGTLCDSEGDWTRLAYLDMSVATQNCPFGFRLYQSGGVRACGRPITNTGSCVSVQFPSNGISYSQICGRVTGHSYLTTDAVHVPYGTNHNNLNGDYVDGVSITRGSPRQHVWTLMANGDDILVAQGQNNCPCINGSTQVPQSFVGSHYFCEGAGGGNWNDLLWDGKDCSFEETLCCSAPGLPWFHRDYGNTTTTDYIELRVCADQGTHNEDAPVSFYEIYIK
uniref:Uncharacterized protein n=1 Tax=Amphimedon queenslandica TaxID=400682 RepID=A0A1X7UV80_AMPQE